MTNRNLDFRRIVDKIDRELQDIVKVTGLDHNPFPFRPTAEDEPKVFVGRDFEIEQIFHFILMIARSKQSSGLLLLGNYGLGKTHTLKYLRTELRRISARTEFSFLPVYVQRPGKSFRDIFYEFVFQAKNEIIKLLKQIIWIELKHEISGNFSEFVSSIFLNTIEQIPIPNNWNELVILIKEGKITKKKISDYISNFLVKYFKNSSVRNALSNALITDNEIIIDLALKYLSGDTVSRKDYADKFELSSTVIDDRDIPEVFNGLIDILSITNDAILIMIDEFEDWADFTPQKIRSLLGDLRATYEKTENKVGWILSSIESAWPVILSHYEAIKRRFPKIVRLPPLEEYQVRELILGYLNHGRLETRSNVKLDTIYPFNEDAIQEIFRYTNLYGEGRLDVLLSICRECFELILNHEVNEISGEIVRRIIEIPEI